MEVSKMEAKASELDLAVRALVEENILEEYHTADTNQVMQAIFPDGVEVTQISPGEDATSGDLKNFALDVFHEEEVISESQESINLNIVPGIEGNFNDIKDNNSNKDTKPCCFICGKKFKNLLNLKRHAVVHSNEYPYVHEICGRKYKRKKGLTAHKRICRVGKVGPGRKQMSSWNVFIRTHSYGLPPVEAIRTLKETWRTLSNEEKRGYQLIGRAGMLDGGTCPKCQKYFKTNHRMKEHLKCCGRTFTCDVCKKNFSSGNSLNVHKVSHTKTFECKVCGKCFGCKSKLKSHSINHDENLKIHFCTCGKRFGRKESLHRHIRKCTGEPKPTENNDVKGGTCSKCSKQFDALNRLREHEKECGLAFPCDVCSKSFKSAKTMRAHKKTHSGAFQCENCKKCFISSSKLNRHSVMHDKSLRTFECPCGKLFGRSDNYKKHVDRCSKKVSST